LAVPEILPLATSSANTGCVVPFTFVNCAMINFL
jgi:hypothetical protein